MAVAAPLPSSQLIGSRIDRPFSPAKGLDGVDVKTNDPFVAIIGQARFPLLQEFVEQFSWKAFFTPKIALIDGVPTDIACRRETTDMEPDDICDYMKMFQALSLYIQQGSGHLHLPTINMIMTEGLDATLEKKAEVIKIIACRMVVEGLIDARVLDCLHFFKDKERATDPDKEVGYQNIYLAAQEMRTPEVDALLLQLPNCRDAAEHDAEYDALLPKIRAAFREPLIWENCISPVNRFMEYYAARPELLPYVNYVGYGSFNLDKALKRIGGDDVPAAAQKLEEMLSSCKRVFNLEAFLATRTPQREASGQIKTDREGNVRYTDFNRVGGNTHPDVFAPLFEADPSCLQRFVLKAFQGWSSPTVNKLKGDLRKLPNGEAFLQELEQKILDGNGNFSLADAMALCDQHVSTAPEDAAAKAVYDQREKKIRILHDILTNKCVQGTLSDYALAEILDKPEELIEPEALSRSWVCLSYANSRVNASFSPDREGNALSIESLTEGNRDISGIRVDRLKSVMRAFFESLKARPVQELPKQTFWTKAVSVISKLLCCER